MHKKTSLKTVILTLSALFTITLGTQCLPQTAEAANTTTGTVQGQQPLYNGYGTAARIIRTLPKGSQWQVFKAVIDTSGQQWFNLGGNQWVQNQGMILARYYWIPVENQQTGTTGTTQSHPKNTLQYLGYTVKFVNNVYDAPEAVDLNQFYDMPRAQWVAEQTAGVWNVNAHSSGGGYQDPATPIYSATDHKNSYFVGHNAGAFTPLLEMKVGNQIVGTDQNGHFATYQVKHIYTMKGGTGIGHWMDSQTGENFTYVLYGGFTERITLQVCVDYAGNQFRVIVADAL